MTDAPLLPPGTWYQPGPATLVRRGAGFVVLVPGVAKRLIDAAWTVLAEAPDPDGFLDELARVGEYEGRDDLPAVIFGALAAERAVIGVKGKAMVAAYSRDGRAIVSGSGDALETGDVASPLRVAFGELPPETGPGVMPIESGIVKIRGFVHMQVDASALEAGARADLLELVEQDERVIEDEEARAKRKASPPPKISVPAPVERRAPAAAPARPAPTREPVAEKAPEDKAPNMFADLFAADPPVPSAREAGGAPSPAPVPTAAPPAPDPTPGPAPAARTAPSPGPAATAASPSPMPAPRQAPRRRLVSTSLFDRARVASEPGGPGSTEATAARPELGDVPSPGADAPAPVEPASESAATPPPAPVEPAPTPEPEPAPAPAPATEPEPEPVPATEPEPAPAPVPEATIAAPPAPGPEPAPAAPTPSSSPEQAAPSDPSPSTPAAPAPSPRSAPEDDASDAYDELFGMTINRRIEDAAVRPTADDHAEPEKRSEEPAEPEDPAPVPDVEEPAPSVEPSQQEFIDWVPGVGRTAADAAATRSARPPARGGDSRMAGPTDPTSRAAAASSPGGASDAGRAQAVPSSSRPSAPRTPVRVGALVCPAGHASSPDRATCRACGAPLAGPVRSVERPSLGTLEISTGGSIPLDRTVVIGRRPRASRVSGDDVPTLITVPSPQQDISRSHVEVRPEGWHVVVVDLATTNGTRLLRGHQEPVRLRPHEGVLLAPGDVLDLGDGVALRWTERA